MTYILFQFSESDPTERESDSNATSVRWAILNSNLGDSSDFTFVCKHFSRWKGNNFKNITLINSNWSSIGSFAIFTLMENGYSNFIRFKIRFLVFI